MFAVFFNSTALSSLWTEDVVLLVNPFASILDNTSNGWSHESTLLAVNLAFACVASSSEVTALLSSCILSNRNPRTSVMLSGGNLESNPFAFLGGGSAILLTNALLGP